tara:strand:+ start:17 stop:433 length:417 start_codon:yes stop_codon:yes gene_type:complete
MPQFDTFTFCSQIFWVLFTFTLLYLSLAYYLLPAIAVTLKVRKRKLDFSFGSDLSNTISLENGNQFNFQSLESMKLSNDQDSASRFYSQPLFFRNLFDYLQKSLGKATLRKRTITHFGNTNSKSKYISTLLNFCLFKI